MPTTDIKVSVIPNTIRETNFKWQNEKIWKTRVAVKPDTAKRMDLVTVKEAMGLDAIGVTTGSYDAVLISWKDAPTKEGWYVYDRAGDKLVEMTKSNENDTEIRKIFDEGWHNRIIIEKSAEIAIAEERPLLLYMTAYGLGNFRAVVLSGDYSSPTHYAAVRRRPMDELPGIRTD